MSAGAETRCIGSEEIDQFCNLFRAACRTACIKGVLFFPVVVDAAIVHFCKILEKIIYKRGMDSSGAYGIDTYIISAQVNRQTPCYLAERSFCQSVCKTVGLSYEPLVRGIDYNAPSSRLYDLRNSLAKSIYGSVYVCLYHQVKLFVCNVEQCIASVDSGIGHDALYSPEPFYRCLHCLADILSAACIALRK